MFTYVAHRYCGCITMVASFTALQLFSGNLWLCKNQLIHTLLHVLYNIRVDTKVAYCYTSSIHRVYFNESSELVQSTDHTYTLPLCVYVVYCNVIFRVEKCFSYIRVNLKIIL